MHLQIIIVIMSIIFTSSAFAGEHLPLQLNQCVYNNDLEMQRDSSHQKIEPVKQNNLPEVVTSIIAFAVGYDYFVGAYDELDPSVKVRKRTVGVIAGFGGIVLLISAMSK